MGWLKINNRKKFVVPERFQDNSFRYYKTPEGIFPSVTSILGETKSTASKQRLKNWQKFNKKEKERVLARGRNLDFFIQNWFDGKYCVPDDVQSQVVNFLMEIYPIGVEYPVHSCLGFAGCFDMLAEHKKKTVLIDWKTSTKRKTAKDIEDYFLQIVAYRYAMIETLGIHPDKCLIVICTEGYKKPTFFEISNQQNIDEYEHKFFDRLKKYQKKHEEF